MEFHLKTSQTIPSFSASKVWFKDPIAGIVAAQKCILQLPRIIKEKHQIFNCDKTALYTKELLSQG